MEPYETHPRIKLVTIDWLLDSIREARRLPVELYKTIWFGSGRGKRTIVVPLSLIVKFKTLASENSKNNIETLGTLGGKLTNDT